MILGILGLSGNTPDSKERFNNGVSSREQGPAAALRILAGVPSAHVALDHAPIVLKCFEDFVN